MRISINFLFPSIIFIFSIFFSFFFVFVIPWEKLVYFVDFDFYLNRLNLLYDSGITSDRQRDYFGLGLLFSEPLWLLILIYMPYIFSDLTNGLSAISFFSLLIYSYYTFRNTNFIVSAILLLNPIFISLIMSQLRIAFAFSLLLLAFQLLKNKQIIAVALSVCAVLIHTASLIFISVYFANILLRKIFKNHNQYFFVMFFSPIMLVVLLNYFLIPVLDFFSDVERVRYSIGTVETSSLLFSFVYLFFCLLIYILPKNKKYEQYIDIIAYTIFMGSLFFILSVFGIYGSRFVAVIFPFFLISIGCLRSIYRNLTYLLMFLYQLVYFSYWITYT